MIGFRLMFQVQDQFLYYINRAGARQLSRATFSKCPVIKVIRSEGFIIDCITTRMLIISYILSSWMRNYLRQALREPLRTVAFPVYLASGSKLGWPSLEQCIPLLHCEEAALKSSLGSHRTLMFLNNLSLLGWCRISPRT